MTADPVAMRLRSLEAERLAPVPRSAHVVAVERCDLRRLLRLAESCRAVDADTATALVRLRDAAGWS